MQPKTLEVIDEVVSRGNLAEQILHAVRARLAALVVWIHAQGPLPGRH
jgi:hypothetical protein